MCLCLIEHLCSLNHHHLHGKVPCSVNIGGGRCIQGKDPAALAPPRRRERPMRPIVIDRTMMVIRACVCVCVSVLCGASRSPPGLAMNCCSSDDEDEDEEDDDKVSSVIFSTLSCFNWFSFCGLICSFPCFLHSI